jgi:hypothetical protein
MSIGSAILGRKRSVGLAGSTVIVVACAVILSQTAFSSSGGPSPQQVATAAQAAISQVGAANVGSVQANGDHLFVGVAGTDGYTAQQTTRNWYAKVVGSAVAHTVGGLNVIDYQDALSRDTIGPDNIYQTVLPAALPAGGCDAVVDSVASSAGVTLVASRTLNLLGGACEVTVVDGGGTRLSVEGWTPGIGGDIGQGIGWRLPSLGSPGLSSGSISG